ncbi:MAG: hypothetical protein H7Z37_15975 [Pyrinomonadaceae bacterium]|nr:hypothetical protein [Pyrinomonadaceae bacterium]
MSFGICFTFNATQTVAQGRDPFLQKQNVVTTTPKPKPRIVTSSGGTTTVAAVKAAPAAVAVPTIEQRIASYKELRLRSAQLGIPAPKPTTVLTLDEVQIIGIFHTPRGYAAMVEATPIKLSYTIYPGEKFFNGQLVAIEDNRLVFRRVTQFNNGKSVVAAESKTLRQQTVQEILTPSLEKASNDSKISTTVTQTATNPTVMAPAINGVNPSGAVQMADNGFNEAKPSNDSDVSPMVMPKAVKSSKANRVEPRKMSPKSKNVKPKVIVESTDDALDTGIEQPETKVTKPVKSSVKPKPAKNSKSKVAPKVETPEATVSEVETPKVVAPKAAVKKAKLKPVVVKRANSSSDAGDAVPTDITSNDSN